MAFGQVKQNIVTLTMANLLIGLVEFVFNLYLSRILGAEGLGMLHLVTPINCLFLSFMTEGLVTTISKISARHYASGHYTLMDRSVKVSTVFSFFWSLALVALVFLTAKPIAVYFLQEPSLTYPILSTCPLMILMSISNIIKGHFLGLAKIRVPALINITEKLFRFPILYGLIRFCLHRFSFPTITLVYLCYAIGEIHSVFWLIVYYRWTNNRLLDSVTIKPRYGEKAYAIGNILKPLIGGAVPICMTQCLLELVNAFSSVVVKSRLCAIGYTGAEALALLGKYKGMVFPLMGYPMILVGATCSIVIPKVSTLLVSGKSGGANRLIFRCLLTAFVIGLLTCLAFWIGADAMGMFFYKRGDLGPMIRLAGLCAPLLDIAIVSTNLLISIGQEGQSFRNALLQQLLLLIFLMVFVGIPALNIYGYIVAIACSNLILLTMNLSCLKRHRFAHVSS